MLNFSLVHLLRLVEHLIRRCEEIYCFDWMGTACASFCCLCECVCALVSSSSNVRNADPFGHYKHAILGWEPIFLFLERRWGIVCTRYSNRAVNRPMHIHSNGRSTWWNAYQAIRKTHTATSLWTNRRVMKKNMASSAEWVLRQNTSEAITIKWLRSAKRRNPIRLTTSTRMWTCVPLNARHPIFLYSYDALRTAACSASNPQYS